MAYTRYQDIPSKTNKQGNRVVRSTLYPPIARGDNDTYVRTTTGDTLYALAEHYYGSVNYYWIIGEANDNIDKSTQILKPGLQLRIPSDRDTILRDFEDLNNS
jgi:phage tail protein X|tara:strand:+ start:259 stop:567 length:309 start_codon:yes stop_codon:yes gene_type:complete